MKRRWTFAVLPIAAAVALFTPSPAPAAPAAFPQVRSAETLLQSNIETVQYRYDRRDRDDRRWRPRYYPPPRPRYFPPPAYYYPPPRAYYYPPPRVYSPPCISYYGGPVGAQFCF